jgi:hypothetical protein
VSAIVYYWTKYRRLRGVSLAMVALALRESYTHDSTGRGMIIPRYTDVKCRNCGHRLEVRERPRYCDDCGGGPYCAVCITAHTEDGEHLTGDEVGDGSDGR